MTDLRILNYTEAAKVLGISRQRVKELAKAGHIPIHHTDDNGRHWFSATVIEAEQRRKGELAAERRAS